MSNKDSRETTTVEYVIIALLVVSILVSSVSIFSMPRLSSSISDLSDSISSVSDKLSSVVSGVDEILERETTPGPITPTTRTKIVWVTAFGTSSQAAEEYIRNYVKQYNEEHPNVNIVYEQSSWGKVGDTLLTRVKGGNPPDMVCIGSADMSYVLSGDALNVDEYVKAYPRLNELPDLVLKPQLWKGEFYATPTKASGPIVAYRKSWLAEKGLEPPTNWDELLNVAMALTEGDRYGWTVTGAREDTGELFVNYALTAGVLFWEYDTSTGKYKSNFDSPDMVRALQFYVDLYRKYKVCPPDSNVFSGEDVVTRFAAGQTAFAFVMAWDVGTILEVVPPEMLDDVGWMRFPQNKSEAVFHYTHGTMFFNPETVEEAVKFQFAFWCDDGLGFTKVTNGGQLTVMPSTIEWGRTSGDPILKIFVEQLPRALAMEPIPARDYIELEIIEKYIMKALNGDMTPEEACANIHEEITAEFEELGLS